MAHYKNDYSEEEDKALWQLHEIRHRLAEQRQSPEQINTTGLQLIIKYKLHNLKIITSSKTENEGQRPVKNEEIAKTPNNSLPRTARKGVRHC